MGLVSILGMMRVGVSPLPAPSGESDDCAKAVLAAPQAISARAVISDLGISLLPPNDDTIRYTGSP
jgi:hypothetical protein